MRTRTGSPRRCAALAVVAALGAGFATHEPAEAAGKRAKRIDAAKLVTGSRPAARGADLDDRSLVRKPRIVGGGAAGANAFPFIVSLVRKDRLAGGPMRQGHGCGGSLITRASSSPPRTACSTTRTPPSPCRPASGSPSPGARA